MIAVDTSSLRRFLSGEEGGDVELVQTALEQNQLAVPPVVLTEILSDPRLQQPTIAALTGLPMLEITGDYWTRAGRLRARVIAEGHKAKVADALIAQSCIDHGVELITHDRDFRHFRGYGLTVRS